MRRSFMIIAMMGSTIVCRAQELFIMTEPASNMPARSLGIRFGTDNRVVNRSFQTRIDGEVMYGVSAPLMVHALAYASNYNSTFSLETVGMYAKYRIFTDDAFKYHVRMALYGKALFGSQNSTTPLGVLSGSSPYLGGGLIATMLLDHFALSTTLGGAGAIPDISLEQGLTGYQKISAFNYSLSAGYLLYPSVYTSYNDPNVNLYFEVLGTRMNYASGASASASELVLAVGSQVILNSIARIDLAFKTSVFSSLPRERKNSIVLKFERDFYNFF